MKLKTFMDIPPWEWPEDAANIFLEILRDDQADESECLLAAKLAGDETAINDKLADALLAILHITKNSDSLRAGSNISGAGPRMCIYGRIRGYSKCTDFRKQISGNPEVASQTLFGYQCSEGSAAAGT